MSNTQPDTPNSQPKSKIVLAILGGVIILVSVIFVSKAADILPAGTDLQYWYIGGVICALVGWVFLFVGILSGRKKP